MQPVVNQRSRWTNVLLLGLAMIVCLLPFQTAQADDDGDYKLYGTIQSLPSTSGWVGDWVVNGRTVHVFSTTKLKQEKGPIALGATVEIEGWLQADGSVNAKEVETKSSTSSGGTYFKFYGQVETLPNTANRVGAWTVSGRTVHVTPTTYIKLEHGPLAVGSYVEVEGNVRADGSIDAFKIETKQGGGGGSNELFKGYIENLPSTAGRIGVWSIGGRQVNVSASTVIVQQYAAVAVGVYVEIYGTLRADGSIDATRIETKNASGSSGGSGSSGSHNEFYGTVESLPTGNIGQWTVSGRKVNVTATTIIEHPERGLMVGSLVEVKGAVQADNSINATKIEIKSGTSSGGSGNNKIYGKIDSLPNDANFLGQWMVAGRKVNVAQYTRIKRKYGTVAVGAYVEVEGLAQADGSLNAKEIEVKQGAGGGAFMSYNPVATVEGASYQEETAPESIVSAFGSNLAAGIVAATTLPLPQTLSDVTVLVDGKQARLFFVSPNQINYQIPASTPLGLANVAIMRGNTVVSQGTILVTESKLAFFAANSDGQGAPAGYVTRVKANGQQSNEPVARLDTAQNKLVPATIQRRGGDKLFLVLFGTGLRAAKDEDGNPGNGVAERVEITIGGVKAEVHYAGVAPGYAGLDQLNILIPNTALANPATEVKVKLRDGEGNIKQGNTLTISLQ